MKRRSFSIIRLIAVGFIAVAVILTALQLVQYSRIRNRFSPGTSIAGIAVGGLEPAQAAERLVQAFALPVEIHYGDAVIQMKPSMAGFTLDLEGMMTAADMQRISQPFWSAFWNYLWNRLPAPSEVPLRATISEDRLRAYLESEVAARYDQPPTAALPVPGTTNFQAGSAGTAMDVDRAVVLIEDALRSPKARAINVTFSQVGAARPSQQNLEVLLKQVIDVSQFDGIVELYMLDLQTEQEVHFAYQTGKDLPVDIAFTAASTIKIPIMASVFRRVSEPTPQSVVDLLSLMIERSENDPADRLMADVINKDTGPLGVTEDMEELGLHSTFLAGYFAPGSPLLKVYQTPANQRTDIYTSPDAYNQTTASEMGMLLNDVYQCAESGGGTFAAVFPEQISQAECRQMIEYLTLNRIQVLMQAGLPEGTRIAHKHGWITEADGLIHAMSDAGIVYTPGGNYVMTVYVWHPVQAVWDNVNLLVAQLSTAVYNYFNLP